MGTIKPKLSSNDFVHLHNHTQYSLLDGLTKVPALMDKVAESGMSAVAITDHGTLSGAIEFYTAAKAHKLKPIIGMEAYVAARTIADKDPSKDKNSFHLILLAQNNLGYQNLMRLSTIANLKGLYYRPRIDHQLLEKYQAGLIVLSGCIGGEIGDHLRNGQYDKASSIAKWYKKVFGDRYYLEVQDHGHIDHPNKFEDQLEVTELTLKLGKELDIPCVVTCDAHYLNHQDQAAHEILLCVQTGSFLSDENRMSLKDFDLSVTDPKAVIKRWGAKHPEVITNTKAIADRCQLNIELGKIMISSYPVPTKETEKAYLHRLVYQGLVMRYGGKSKAVAAKLSVAAAKQLLSKEVLERAEYELGVIEKMGFGGYFLIVQDFINWGKDRGIIFGAGRGSGAASIVAYALRITEIEPLAYGLLFERFLNPDRISMPDFDIDIQDTRRDEVIQYCIDKYGADRVANIVTFGRMAARNAVRDVARVTQVPYVEADRLAKMIPPPIQGRHIPLAESLKQNPELRQEYATNETAKQVFDLAIQLEGTIRSHGVHAAGVVIAPDDIVKFSPLEMAQKGVVATQYPMGPIDELGLLKIDFLGLSNLTIINNALRIIRKVYQVELDLNRLATDDKQTFELFRRGDTTGVFQMESTGMKRYLKQLKPTEFEDIIAMNALYRPGPMQEIPRFIECKNNPAAITYLNQSLEPVLGETYGVIVYQEQIIKLLQLVAGYTPGEADLVRKAIGKKNREIMKAEEPRFLEGCLRQGLSAKQAAQLWAQIQPFADYSFNKAHATCYAQIAYQTAYLKAHYPSAFMAALMTSDYDDTERLAIEITECKHMGIEVLPPDVNESFVEFAIVPGKQPKIRFGMNAVKNVGTAAVEEILRAREVSGSFKDLEDFLAKVNPRIVNRKALESLIKAGALDRFNDRSTLLANLDLLLAYAARLQNQADSGQTDLFGNLIEDVSVKNKLKLMEADTVYTPREQLLWERELLGLYLSQQPLAMYENFLSEQAVPINSLNLDHDGRKVVVGGAITDVREITTKNGQKMAFVKLEDQLGEIELVLFPGAYQVTLGLWKRDQVVLVQGKVSTATRDSKSSSELKIMVDNAREITAEQASAYSLTGKKAKTPAARAKSVVATTEIISEVTAPKAPRVYIRLLSSEDQQLLMNLKATIDNHQGDTEVVLVLGTNANKQIIKLPNKINNQKEVLARLSETVGAANVKLS